MALYVKGGHLGGYKRRKQLPLRGVFFGLGKLQKKKGRRGRLFQFFLAKEEGRKKRGESVSVWRKAFKNEREKGCRGFGKKRKKLGKVLGGFLLYLIR